MKSIVIIAVILVFSGAYFYLNPNLLSLNNEPITVKFMGAETPADHFISGVIKDKGIDIKHGINLEVIRVAPGETFRVITEKVDGIEVGTIPTLSLIDANLKGAKLRAFAAFLWGGLDFIVKSGSQYNTFADLKGARIATRPAVSAAHKNLTLAIKASGYDLGNDFKFTFGSIPDNLKAFFAGEVDAVLNAPLGISEPIATGRARAMLDLDSHWRKLTGTRMSFVLIAAHEDWIEKNPDLLKKMQKMFIEGGKYIADHPEVIDEYKDVLGLTTPGGIAQAKSEINRVVVDSWDPELHKITIKKAIELGINPPASYDDYFIK